MEKVEYKYAPKTKVFFFEMVTIPTLDKCHLCDGEGKLMKISGEFITCPRCLGEKTINSGGRHQYVVRSGNIKSIDINIKKNYKVITYWINQNPSDASDDYDETKVYPTEEEALASIPKGASGYAGTQGTVGTPK